MPVQVKGVKLLSSSVVSQFEWEVPGTGYLPKANPHEETYAGVNMLG